MEGGGGVVEKVELGRQGLVVSSVSVPHPIPKFQPLQNFIPISSINHVNNRRGIIIFLVPRSGHLFTASNYSRSRDIVLRD